jgi:hypothetical protein
MTETPSSVDLAPTIKWRWRWSATGSAMAQTFGALALGLKDYRPELRNASA